MRQTFIGPTRTDLGAYTTGLWDAGHNGRPDAPYNGSGWTIGLRRYEHASRNYFRHVERIAKERGFFPPTDTECVLQSNGKAWFSAPELIIFARSLRAAQNVARLLFAANLVYAGDSVFLGEIVPIPESEAERARHDPRQFHGDVGFMYTGHLATAAAIAARLSRRKKLQYAALKFVESHRSFSVPLIETDPRRGRRLGVTRDREQHVQIARAMSSAYGVLEDLGFEMRVPSGKSSRDARGEWNPEVKAELERRLIAGGIDLSDDEVWMARGTPTRLERARALPVGAPASWTRGAVRDRHMPLVDAIARASWLRSKIGAHGASSLTPSLTPLDLANLQFLARRLILEHIGFLPGTKTHARNLRIAEG